MKQDLKEIAIRLRKNGQSYSEILSTVPVAKSTLSLWLRSIGLSKRQKQRLTEKKIASIKRGHILWKQRRIDRTQELVTVAAKEVETLSSRELWLIGVALYWAEGSKQNSKTVSQGIKFTNSDPYMIKVFHVWLTRIIKVEPEKIGYEIYIHETMVHKKPEVIQFWSKILGKPESKFDRIYLKRNKITKIYPKSDYNGVLRIVVKKSTNLNRQVTGWQQGIIHSCRVV